MTAPHLGAGREGSVKCSKCDGCGQVANSEDQEPWSFWMDLPVKSAAAVMLGLVKPITCPHCNGSGKSDA